MKGVTSVFGDRFLNGNQEMRWQQPSQKRKGCDSRHTLCSETESRCGHAIPHGMGLKKEEKTFGHINNNIKNPELKGN